MNQASSDHLISYAGYRFPTEVMSYTVCVVLSLSIESANGGGNAGSTIH